MATPTLNVLSLCAGVGMLDIAVGLACDARTVCYIEREAFAAGILAARMEDQAIDEAPIWSDLTTFDGAAWRGTVDCITAGFPCQPHSAAGKRKGLDDERWLWDDIARIIRDVEPWIVYLENVPGLITTGGLAAVIASLAEMGFAAEWGCVSAASVGASHKRERIFILAVKPRRGWGKLRQPSGGDGFADRGGEGVADANSAISSADIDRPDAVANGRHDFSGCGGNFVGDTENGNLRRELEAHGTRGGRGGFTGTIPIMADTSSPGSQGREQRGARNTDRGGQETHGPVSQLCGIFAPGPGDQRWADIIAAKPWLAPAIPSSFDARACETQLRRALRPAVVGRNKRARRVAAARLAVRLAPLFAKAAPQPGLCKLADGVEFMVDASRADQLRAIGNGVVATAAAAAFTVLARRAGVI